MTGFELPEIDILIGDAATTAHASEADEPPLPAEGPAVTPPADLWQVSDHRLICGDSTKQETYETLLVRA
jgi:hypothetical protein